MRETALRERREMGKHKHKSALSREPECHWGTGTAAVYTNFES